MVWGCFIAVKQTGVRPLSISYSQALFYRNLGEQKIFYFAIVVSLFFIRSGFGLCSIEYTNAVLICIFETTQIWRCCQYFVKGEIIWVTDKLLKQKPKKKCGPNYPTQSGRRFSILLTFKTVFYCWPWLRLKPQLQAELS